VLQKQWQPHIAKPLNSRPRQALGWKTPDEVLGEEIKLFHNRVSLDS
jgi:IS30 family transposase